MSYFDASGNIYAELLDQKAKDQADKFVEYHFNRRRQKNELNKQKSLSSAQLRRFFSEFRQLEKKVKAKGFEKVKPLVKMVKSKASYAANPSNPKIPKAFKDFLIKNVDEINNEEEFGAFMLHFEAVVGFYYGLEGVSSR